jgi:hypothetical protein
LEEIMVLPAYVGALGPHNKRENALITGASSGIGLDLAKLMAPDFDLIITARAQTELVKIARELEASQGKHVHVISRGDCNQVCRPGEHGRTSSFQNGSHEITSRGKSRLPRNDGGQNSGYPRLSQQDHRDVGKFQPARIADHCCTSEILRRSKSGSLIVSIENR